MKNDYQGLIHKITKNKKEIHLTVGIKDQRGTTIKVYGVNGQERANQGQRYEIGSLTKIITTSLLAKHLASGKLSLEDSLQSFFPELEELAYYPTIRRLATHRSGYQSFLPYSRGKHLQILGQALVGGANPFRHNTSLCQLKSVVGAVKLVAKEYPYVYSNINYSILGYILAEIEGKSYVEAMTAWLVSELGVSQTNFSEAGILPGDNSLGQKRENWLWEAEDTAVAAGGLYSTAADLLQIAFLHNQLKVDYLGQSHFKLAEGTSSFDMALGWKLPQGQPVLWHNGGTGCFSSFLGFNQESKKEVVILSNYRSLLIDKLGLALLIEAGE